MDACRPMGIPVCMEAEGPLVDTLGQGARKIADGLFSKIFNRGGGRDRARPMPRRREPAFMMNRGGRGYDHRMGMRSGPGRMMGMDRGFDEFGGGYDEFDEFGGDPMDMDYDEFGGEPMDMSDEFGGGPMDMGYGGYGGGGGFY